VDPGQGAAAHGLCADLQAYPWTIGPPDLPDVPTATASLGTDVHSIDHMMNP
jgi:hypothetical protein